MQTMHSPEPKEYKITRVKCHFQTKKPLESHKSPTQNDINSSQQVKPLQCYKKVPIPLWNVTQTIQIHQYDESRREQFIEMLNIHDNTISYYYGETLNGKCFGQGKIFREKYDDQFNVTYEVLSGKFNQQNELTGEVYKYYGKSNKIMQKLYYYNEQRKDVLQQYNFDGSVQEAEVPTEVPTELPRRSKIKIIDVSTNEEVKLPARKTTSTIAFNNAPWYQYGQQYYQKDIRILESKTEWLNSNIINGFATYLNIKLIQDQVQQKQFKSERAYIIKSTFYTNIRFTTQADSQLKEEFAHIASTEYSIFNLYDRILIVINANNSHWYLLKLHLNNNQVQFTIYDSMSSIQSNYDTLCRKIWDNLQQLKLVGQFEYGEVVIGNCPKQQNGYSCGDHVCFNMKRLWVQRDEDVHSVYKCLRTTDLMDVVNKKVKG